MEHKKLVIDDEFKHLIRPLKRKEFLQLEENLLRDGCRDPIVVWNDVIVDGHNRYEICTRHGIPFYTKDMEFECREAAIAWICANQLGRRNITEETRKFLIGMQYESEKVVTRIRNKLGRNQHSEPDPEDTGDDDTVWAVIVNMDSSGSLKRRPCWRTFSLSGVSIARGASYSIRTAECSPRWLLTPESCRAVMHRAMSVTEPYLSSSPFQCIYLFLRCGEGSTK